MVDTKVDRRCDFEGGKHTHGIGKAAKLVEKCEHGTTMDHIGIRVTHQALLPRHAGAHTLVGSLKNLDTQLMRMAYRADIALAHLDAGEWLGVVLCHDGQCSRE